MIDKSYVLKNLTKEIGIYDVNDEYPEMESTDLCIGHWLIYYFVTSNENLFKEWRSFILIKRPPIHIIYDRIEKANNIQLNKWMLESIVGDDEIELTAYVENALRIYGNTFHNYKSEAGGRA